MKKVGIIAEYNPFHNGHIYHLNKIKEIFPDSAIILVLSSSFTQRGIPNILTKWDRCEIALKYGVDLVIELPYPFSVQSADVFAKGSIEILKELQVDYLVFGSEENDIEKLKKIAQTQINDKEFNEKVKKYLDKGNNYPTALNLALKDIIGNEVNTPNDLLGVSYIKEIIKQNANIEPITIKRTNSYHEEELTKEIASATSIRNALKNNLSIKEQVPKETLDLCNKKIPTLNDYFNLLKYKIYTLPDLSIFLDVDEGIDKRILKCIDTCSNIEELIDNLKTKRYTYNKITRMLNHILCGYTKEENKKYEHVPYIRVLGFTKEGQQILSEIKKELNIPLITKFQKDIEGLQLEKRITGIYASIFDEKEKQELILNEYKNTPFYKNLS